MLLRFMIKAVFILRGANSKLYLHLVHQTIEMIKNAEKNIEDYRSLYSDFKDINEWLINNVQQEEKLGSRLVQKVPKVYNKRSR